MEIGNKKLAQGLDKKKDLGPMSQQRTLLTWGQQYR